MVRTEWQPPVLTVRGRGFDWASRTLVMGVLNVTPDSFSDGGRFAGIDAALRHADRLLERGADFIDVGGESTRPALNAAPVPCDEELRRVVPVIEALGRRTATPISIDTYKARVARAAVDAGAAMVNDISALRFDDDMAKTVADLRVPVVLMHSRGTLATLHQQDDDYGERPAATVARELARRIETACAAGIAREQILVDPGIGFSKGAAENLAILADMEPIAALGHAMVVGTSRKSFLGALTGRDPLARDEASAASVVAAILGGAHVVRVHDPAAVRDAVLVADAIRRARPAALGRVS